MNNGLITKFFIQLEIENKKVVCFNLRSTYLYWNDNYFTIKSAPYISFCENLSILLL